MLRGCALDLRLLHPQVNSRGPSLSYTHARASLAVCTRHLRNATVVSRPRCPSSRPRAPLPCASWGSRLPTLKLNDRRLGLALVVQRRSGLALALMMDKTRTFTMGTFKLPFFTSPITFSATSCAKSFPSLAMAPFHRSTARLAAYGTSMGSPEHHKHCITGALESIDGGIPAFLPPPPVHRGAQHVLGHVIGQVLHVLREMYKHFFLKNPSGRFRGQRKRERERWRGAGIVGYRKWPSTVRANAPTHSSKPTPRASPLEPQFKPRAQK